MNRKCSTCAYNVTARTPSGELANVCAKTSKIIKTLDWYCADYTHSAYTCAKCGAIIPIEQGQISGIIIQEENNESEEEKFSLICVNCYSVLDQ